MSERGIDVNVNSLDEDEVPNPAQPWKVARRCIRMACGTTRHDSQVAEARKPSTGLKHFRLQRRVDAIL